MAAFTTPVNYFSRRSIDATRLPTLTDSPLVTPYMMINNVVQHTTMPKSNRSMQTHAPPCLAQSDDAYTTASNTKILDSELTTLCKHIISEPSLEGTSG